MDNSGLIKSVEYLCRKEEILLCVIADERTYCDCILDGVTYEEIANKCEPFDFRVHLFMLPSSTLEKVGSFELRQKQRSKKSKYFSDREEIISRTVDFDRSKVLSEDVAISRSDRNLSYSSTEDSGRRDGASWTRELYLTDNGAPVRVFTLVASSKDCSFYAGTPYGKTEFVPNEIQLVMEEALEIERDGRKVLASTNADFFDMFGDCHPSGLCVSRGIAVTNADSEYAFFGIKRSGEPVISTLADTPLAELSEAVAGRQIIVSEGKIADTAPLQLFGDTAHPRTAVGISAEGDVIVMVVDGRRPEWSNGATLTDLAKLMISHGAVRALNLDGGGSSTFIVRRSDDLEMLNHPADLERPMEDLIRPVYNSLVITSK